MVLLGFIGAILEMHKEYHKKMKRSILKVLP